MRFKTAAGCWGWLGLALMALLRAGAEGTDEIEALVPVSNPPPVQMLVPGFAVREVPVELTNINNLRYRPDGQLYALGYNGDVWLLRDADGDGLPDAKTLFFDSQGRLRGPIGMAVIPQGHALVASEIGQAQSRSRGVVVASKGKISALLDADGDDVAETERIIATGWKEIPQNVDAVGIAIHPDDGAIFFGLGTAAYNNAYLLDKEGQSAFDLRSERGTIQRIEPDLSARKTICTGVRFTIGMEFGPDKELFVSEQEGATWLPNGNPFDELLHIQSGKHYGFPPRHPRHLPSVFDEPSLFDYAPQHQSTCGMVFNVPVVAGGGTFGPAEWRGDLMVCGESRGKLYRTRLVRKQNGEYVASNQLVGCLGMLTVDCCLTPRGDLLVACHSGGPDWGTGPTGKGKIFHIRYEEQQLPQPTAAWAAAPQEVRVLFDRPLEAQHLKNLAAQAKISYGEYVAAADRFETIRPGYAVTKLQQSQPRFKLPIYAASVSPDRKTLILATAPHPAAVQYALTLPGLGREATAKEGVFPQHPQIDPAYSLNGVAATWEPREKGERAWNGWLPHLDLEVAKAWRMSDTEQDRLWEVIQRPGTLTLTAQVDPRGLFYPAVQPGSKLDYERREDGFVTAASVRIRGSRPFRLAAPGIGEQQAARQGETYEAVLALDRERMEPTAITLRVETGMATAVLAREEAQRLTLDTAWVAELASGQVRSGSLALHRLLLPWANANPTATTPTTPRTIPELAAASWGRGRRIFFSEEAACAKCHSAQEDGRRIGADLSNLIHRDYDSVLRDVTLPSFAINPDFITYSALLTDGRVLSGALSSEGDRLFIADKDGKVTTVGRAEVQELEPSPLSIMPEGLPQKLGPDRMKDLLAYLLLEPPHMPRDAQLKQPPPRKRSEVAAVLAGAESSRPNPKPLQILLVAGKKDHGPGEHDYPAWLACFRQLLEAAEGVRISTAMEWPSAEQLRAADTIVFFQKGAWNAERAAAIDAHLAKGGGLVYLHWAIEGGAEATAFAQRIGLASDSRQTKYRHGPLELSFQAGRGHPISRNFDRVHFHDESYWQLQGEESRLRVLASGDEVGAARPLFWTLEPGPGRVFVSILGHYSWTFDDPLFRILVLRGIAWSAKEPVDRFNELALPGSDVAD